MSLAEKQLSARREELRRRIARARRRLDVDVRAASGGALDLVRSARRGGLWALAVGLAIRWGFSWGLSWFADRSEKEVGNGSDEREET